jgi:Fic family protein
MKPPFEITPEILKLVASVSAKIGEANAYHLDKPTPILRKKNRVRTIRATLQIEGNTLNEDQITAILDKKRVLGS